METDTTTPQPSKSAFNNPLAVPLAIILGFGLVATAIFFSGGEQRAINFAADAPAEDSEAAAIRPVDDTDHIKGNPNAPIVLVEYSDYDCAFCKQFHETMNRIMDEYGPSGKVAWVYRHFPLQRIHPNAPMVAAASECVAALGGNDAFWEFSDLIFEDRDTNELTNITALPDYAAQVGVDVAAYEACVADGDYISEVEADIADGLNAGARGTPHTLVLVGGQQGTINGAQSYETVKQLIENLLTQIEGGTGR